MRETMEAEAGKARGALTTAAGQIRDAIGLEDQAPGIPDGEHAGGAPDPDRGPKRIKADQTEEGPIKSVAGAPDDPGPEGLDRDPVPETPVPDRGTKRYNVEHEPDPDQPGDGQAAIIPSAPAADTQAAAPKARPVPEPTGEGHQVSLWGDIALKVYPEERGTYPVEFLKGEARICIEAPRSPPWLSSKLQERLTAGLTSALGDEARQSDFMRRKVSEAFVEIARGLETDDGTRRALTPAPVRRIMEQTEAVIVYPGEATYYEVTIAGRALTITAAQMARTDPGFINAAVLNAFPLDPLDATRNDWKAIKTYWLSPDVAEVREVEEATEIEDLIDRLREDLETVALVGAPEQVTGDNTAWRDPAGEVWIPARRIARFLNETANKPGWSSRLSKEVRRAGGMRTATRTRMLGSPPRKTRCWVFAPDFAAFRDGRTGGGTVGDYLAGEGGENG
jgi:hypothetical protein